ncbi:hypothetical protein [Marinobacter pelagius]|uniref:Uncharacterized protein n=1 Tax=Marinobacter pelagius TaxID=379482 RepID=A0A1I4R473_9GAMM|nr:hypothetical protein [Marinobacter pelagius]SFM47114.1 hypothetical protein SAMN04487961_0377 [Marinobacter pelagius]
MVFQGLDVRIFHWRTGLLAGLLVFAAVSGPALAQSEDESSGENGEAFIYEERSTIDTIPLRSIEEDALANTVVEGGLAAPAEGVAVKPRSEDDFYLDPLALQPRDERTDLGRSEIPVDIRFSNPKSVPGQTHSNNYVIRPPENRTYDTLNTNLIER